MSATYTKLRDGSWGVRVQGPVKAGETITVTKKGGETKRETVAAVLWTGDGVSLCSVTPTAKPAYQPQASRPGKTYRKSAQAGGGRGYCDDDCYGCSRCM